MTGKRSGRRRGGFGKQHGAGVQYWWRGGVRRRRRRRFGKRYVRQRLQSQRERRSRLGMAMGMWGIYLVTLPQGSTGGYRRSMETWCTPTLERTAVGALQTTRRGRQGEKPGGHARAAVRRAERESRAPHRSRAGCKTHRSLAAPLERREVHSL